MIKLHATLILLFMTASTALGATAEFIFFNKLGLLVLLSMVMGGMLALGGYVIASHLVEKFKRPQPARIPVEQRGRDFRARKGYRRATGS